MFDCHIYFSHTFLTQQVLHLDDGKNCNQNPKFTKIIRQSRTKKAINYENISKGYKHTLKHTITFKNKYNFDFFSQD